MINFLIITLGILGPLFFIVFCFFVARGCREFYFRKMWLSELGMFPDTFWKFNIVIYVFTLCQLLFTINLLNFYNLMGHFEISLNFIIPLLMFLTIPYFSIKRHRYTHIILAIIGFSLMFIGGLAFAFELMFINFNAGFISLLIALVLVCVVIADFIKNKNVFAPTEFVIFGGILVWNIINAIPLF